MLVKKVRCLGLLVLVVALAAFLTGCRYPSNEDDPGGGIGAIMEVERLPGFPGGGGGAGGGGSGGSGGGSSGLATIQEQISFALSVYMNPEILPVEVFIVRANFANELILAQQDLNFRRNVTVHILPPAGYAGTRIITGNNDTETGVLSLFVVRSGNRLVLDYIIVQENDFPIRQNALITVGGYDASLEMTGRTAITGGSRRAVNVHHNSSLIMRDYARIHQNKHTGDGGGVWLGAGGVGATLKMLGEASIYSNTSGGRGGGVAAHYGAVVIMKNDAVIRNNTANNGGGVALTANRSRLYIHDNALIRNNNANTNGGGVFMESNAPVNGIGHTIVANGNASTHIHSNQAGNLGDDWRMSGNGNSIN